MLEKLRLSPGRVRLWAATVLEARLVRKVRPEKAAIQNRAGQVEPRIRACKGLPTQRAKAAPGQLEAVVGPAARGYEVRELPGQAADRPGAERVAVVWAVQEQVAASAGVGAAERAAEQGNKSGLFLAWAVARELSAKCFCELGTLS
jgi:hypothetical protein